MSGHPIMSAIAQVSSNQDLHSGSQAQDAIQCHQPTRRSSRNAPPPNRLSPEQVNHRTKSYALNKSKALASKEKTLSRPPIVGTMKQGGTFVLELQLVMFEAFQQAHRAMVSSKPNYSIQNPPSSNKLTLDGHMDSESDQVLINGKKAYVVNYLRTTCRVTVNGSRTATFLRDDVQDVLDMLSGLSIQQVATLTRQAYDAIQACKPTLKDSNLTNRGTCDTGIRGHSIQAADPVTQQSGSNPQVTQQALSIMGPNNPAGADSQAGHLTQTGALVRPTFQPAEVELHIDQRILDAQGLQAPTSSISSSVCCTRGGGDAVSLDQDATTTLALPPPAVKATFLCNLLSDKSHRNLTDISRIIF